MDWIERYLNILIALLTLVGVVVVIVKRPITPKLTRWGLKHQWLVATLGPFVFFLWGGTIWTLIILKGDFSNVVAMVFASLIICTGVFLFFLRFRG